MVDTGTVPRVHRTPLTPLSNYYSERRQKENQLFVVVCRGRCRAPEFEVASAEEPVIYHRQETGHLWWHRCLGSDTCGPTVAFTSAAGLTILRSSVAPRTTTDSGAAGSRWTGRHRTLGQRPGADVWTGNESETRVDERNILKHDTREEKSYVLCLMNRNDLFVHQT